MSELLEEIHPGEILLHEFLQQWALRLDNLPQTLMFRQVGSAKSRKGGVPSLPIQPCDSGYTFKWNRAFG